MSKSFKTLISGRIHLKNEQTIFFGNEMLYVAVRDSLEHDAECIELGSQLIYLTKNQIFPMNYRFSYDPNRAHMKFNELLKIPGGITISARIERNGKLLYINNTDIPLMDDNDIELVKVD